MNEKLIASIIYKGEKQKLFSSKISNKAKIPTVTITISVQHGNRSPC
jgi:hypothetical protein